MAGYSTKNTTLNKGNLKDITATVLGDGYGGDAYYAHIDKLGNQHTVENHGIPFHRNGTANIAPSDIVFPLSSEILIQNLKSNSCTCILQVSFNNGVDYLDIPRKGSLCLSTEITTFKVRSNENGCSYQALITGSDC